MITLAYNQARRKALQAAISQVLSPSQQTMVRELVRTENPKGPEPQPEDMLYWIRLNMPIASQRIDRLLNPRDC